MYNDRKKNTLTRPYLHLQYAYCHHGHVLSENRNVQTEEVNRTRGHRCPC